MATVPIVSDSGEYLDPARIINPIRDRIRQGLSHRERFEPVWNSNLAWAKGQHWHVWDRDSRTLRRIEDVDPRYKRRELYSVDLITQYRSTVLGELGSDDDRPQLLLQQESPASERYQAQLNRAMAYAWDYEIDADLALAEVDRLTVDMGTAGMRCRFDPTQGPEIGEVPFFGGEPLMGDRATEMMSQYQGGPVPGVEMQAMKAGRILWEPLSGFNLVPPPGITNERYFPWECVVRPTHISEVYAEYGEAAQGLLEDKNIASSMGMIQMSGQGGAGYTLGEGRESRLRDHVWLYTYYERPTQEYPQGRVLHFAGKELKLLRVENSLPYAKLDFNGQPTEYCSGIVYFHYWRVTGQFWSRSLVENLKEANRAYDKRRTQVNEMIDRGLPTVFVRKGSEAMRRTDVPLEMVELGTAEQKPDFFQGIPPGPWMKEEIEQLESDMEQASGIRAPALGENPSNVLTIGQLSLLREADQVKRQPTMIGRKQSIAELVKYSVYDIKKYWGPEKQIVIAGESDIVEADVFDATQIPPFFIVKISKGAAKPRSQGAELTKIEQLWNAATVSQVVLSDPFAWIEWYYESLEAGMALELPSVGQDDQAEKAEIENHKMYEGEDMPVGYYDPIEVHLPIHRSAQIQAELAGNMGVWMRIEKHVQDHLQAQRLNMEATMAESRVEPPPPEPDEGT